MPANPTNTYRYPLAYRVAVYALRVVAALLIVALLLLAFLLFGEERPERARPTSTPAERQRAFRNPNLNWQYGDE